MPTHKQDGELVVFPRWLVPVEPAGVVLEDHALVVDHGRIIDILPADFARQTYAPRDCGLQWATLTALWWWWRARNCCADRSEGSR